VLVLFGFGFCSCDFKDFSQVFHKIVAESKQLRGFDVKRQFLESEDSDTQFVSELYMFQCFQLQCLSSLR